MQSKQEPVLASFHPAIAQWFIRQYGEPTLPQAQGWPLIAAGQNVLLLAPTGSGKTLAAFLKCLDWLYHEVTAGRAIDGGVKVLYISPLKALNNDIFRNLEQPLQGIEATARELGLDLPRLTTAVRTGDTPGNERQRMVRRPPHILITTPESLFLILSSQARQILTTVRFVIVDEIHTLYPAKRGAHLALSLERLEHLIGESQRLQRIGLSATMRPLEGVAAFLGGYAWDRKSSAYQVRPVAIVDAGQRKTLDLKILLPVPDFRELPEHTIWPAIYRQIWELVQQHRTTLVFVNNRRLAERVTINLNQLAGREIARTHHGSVSKELRQQAEGLLKAGEIPCIVATASLELGIDIGHIDLVVQIETPKEVARGLQRVGRAGHVVGMPSQGRLIPKTRGDLLECAALLREMKAGRVEPTKAVCNCLDILAQQLVALTAAGAWTVEEAWRLVRGAYNFQTLSRNDFENVLKMLAGKFETEAFVDLRPRLYWDQSSGELKADAYGKRLVYAAGGTIPDRGYYGVYLAGNQGVRLGELDEEFVYERRLNERFVLGTSVWRIEEIRQDRVLVSPARKTGEAIVPFWKAEQPGRPFELGKRLGAFLAELEARLESPELQRWLGEECGLDERVAGQITQYVAAQKASVGVLHSDHRVVVEEFPDEAGEWRVLVHSPFGMRVHLTLGLLIREAWERECGVQVEVVPGDDGIMFHLPGGSKPPVIDWEGLPLETLEERVAALMGATPLFGIVFRHAAQISLVMPRTGYGRKRTPFWLSRLKAGNLLHTVSRYPDFPLVIETYRAVLRDYLEIEALGEVLQGIRQGNITVAHCRHQTPSPFAGSHLFKFTGSFMYEGEAPKTEERQRLFGLRAETLKTLIAGEGFREVLDPAVVDAVERKARGIDLLGGGVTREQAQAWLERLGDVTRAEIGLWLGNVAAEMVGALEALAGAGKVRKLTLADGQEGYGDKSQPENWEWSERESAKLQEDQRRLIRKFARRRGIFQAEALSARYGIPLKEVGFELAVMQAEGLMVNGAFRPGSTGDDWCEANLWEEMRRRSLARTRRAVEPVTPVHFAVFLADWQGLGSERTGLEGLAEILQQLEGVWLAAETWEQSVLPGRVSGYRRVWLDQLIGSGMVVWRARGSSGQLQLSFETVGSELPASFPVLPGLTCAETEQEMALAPGTSVPAQTILDLLARQGALSLPQILQATRLSTVVAWQALEELLLQQQVTNDSLGPIRYLLTTETRERSGARGVLQPAALAQMGRWSLLAPAAEPLPLRLYRLLNRYGLVCREIAHLEGVSWSEAYPLLDLWENVGRIKRGYFVTGLSGIQFVLPGAVERLNGKSDGACRMVGWSDPANPLRIFPEWLPEDECLKPWGDFLVFESGRLLLQLEGQKKMHLKTRPEIDNPLFLRGIKAFLQAWQPTQFEAKLTVARINGQTAGDSPLAGVLVEAGFEKGYRELTLWPSKMK